MTKKTITTLILSACLAMPFSVFAEEPAATDPIAQAAEQGDAKSEAKLGAMFLLGQGQEKNEAKAFEWFSKAAKQGDVRSQAIVAAMYDSGVGVANDVKAATQWYEKAAAQGHGPSQAILGKNAVAKGGVAFSYQSMRLKASKQIPSEYARQILMEK